MEKNILIQEIFTDRYLKLISQTIVISYGQVAEAKLQFPQIFRYFYKDVESRIKHTVVENSLFDLFESENIPEYKASWVPNRTNSHHHMEARDSENGLIITTSQTNRVMALPNKSKYRQELNKSNDQISFFDKDKIDKNIKTHIILTHGYQSEFPAFIAYGIPSVDGKSWLRHESIPYKLAIGQSEDIIPDDLKLNIKKHVTDAMKTLKDQ